MLGSEHQSFNDYLTTYVSPNQQRNIIFVLNYRSSFRLPNQD